MQPFLVLSTVSAAEKLDSVVACSSPLRSFGLRAPDDFDVLFGNGLRDDVRQEKGT